MSTVATLIDEFHAHTDAAKAIVANRERLKMSLASAMDEKLLVDAELTTTTRRYAGTLVLSPKDSKLEADAYEGLQVAKLALKRIEAKVRTLAEALAESEQDQAERKHKAAANSALFQAWSTLRDAQVSQVPAASRQALVRGYAAACRAGGSPGSWGTYLANVIQCPSIPELDAAANDLIKSHGLAA